MFTARYGLIPYIKQIMFGLSLTVVESVYSAVRTDNLNEQITFGFEKVIVPDFASS